MERVKKWLMSRRTGSAGAIFMGSAQDLTLVDPHDRLQSQYELTSIKIRHLLEKKQFQKVVDLLRELPRDHVLNCLESFPFITLNKAVPSSFLIWETLLTKLKNSEDGYIPQFPYKSCDDLMMRVGWLMENNPGVDELQHSCRRVLKCVYMQYNEVLEQLYKEHERVNHALYTLTRHSPLGLGGSCTTLSLEQAIKEEVEASLEDYSIALECLNDLGQHCEQVKANNGDENEDLQTLSPSSGSGDGEEASTEDSTSKQIGTQPAPNPTQVQLHERLYRNQRMFNSLKPSRRSDTLLQMVDHLKERIRGDKEVLHLFAKIRSRNLKVNKHVPVQPWLRKYEHALDLVIGAIKDIEKELEITVGRVESPMQFGSGSTITSDEGGIQMIHISSVRPRSKSYESERPLRHSAAPILDYAPMEEEGSGDMPPRLPHRHLSIPNSFRPRSASPNKLLRVHGGSGGSPGAGSDVGHAHIGSMKSISSASNDSSCNLVSQTSSSVHDLHYTGDQPPSLAFTRVQSLKTNKSVQVVAGKRKKLPITPNSLTNLTANSVSSGSMNYYSSSGKKKKHSCGSAELAQAWDRHAQVSGDRCSEGELMLRQTLQLRDEELMCLQLQVQELRKRERALTDRLSEQAQRHLQGSEKFEDILMGNQRPTQVTQTYSELFSQTRVEALDEIEAVVSISELGASLEPNFTEQLLLDVLTISYGVASRALEQLHATWKTNLSVDSAAEDSVAVKQLEAAVSQYLRRVSMKHDTSSIVENILEELSSCYAGCAPVYEKVCSRPQFISYVQECAGISWSLCVQNPPMVLDCGDTEFQSDKHCRLYKSNMSSGTIVQYLWPTLLQKSSGTVLSLGWVQT